MPLQIVLEELLLSACKPMLHTGPLLASALQQVAVVLQASASISTSAAYSDFVADVLEQGEVRWQGRKVGVGERVAVAEELTVVVVRLLYDPFALRTPQKF